MKVIKTKLRILDVSGVEVDNTWISLILGIGVLRSDGRFIGFC